MAKKTISITNPKVLEAYEKAVLTNKASKLIEEAVLYYLESIEQERISREVVKDIVIDCLKGMSMAPGQISNPNYSLDELEDAIHDILEL